MHKKIVISPSNKKAIEFFDDLSKKKAKIRKAIERSAIVSRIKEKVKKA